VLDLRLAFMVLLLDLCPAGAAATQTLGHLNLTRTPIYLQVVLTKPGLSQYHVLVAKTGYSEMSMFCVVSVLENCVYHLTDGSRFVGHTINIVYWDGACKGLGSKLVLLYVVPVNESPSALQSRRAFTDLVSWVSVVKISTLMFREFAEGVAVTTYFCGSCLSQCFRQTG